MPHSKKTLSKKEAYQRKFERAIRMVQTGARNLKGAAEAVGINPKKFSKNYKALRDSGSHRVTYNERGDVKVSYGRRPYLSDQSLRALLLYMHSLDALARPGGDAVALRAMRAFRAFEDGVEENDVDPPKNSTRYKYMEKLKGLKRKRMRDSPSFARASKIDRRYLVPHFENLENLELTFQLTASKKWNCDEVGLSVANKKFNVYTSRQTARVDLSDAQGHVTCCLTTSASGAKMAPFVIFQGKSHADVPASIDDTDEDGEPFMTVAVQENGYMDDVGFQLFVDHFLAGLERACGPFPARGTHLLIVDGHNSRLQPTQIVKLAMSGVVVYCIPSHTSHVLQPNDSGTNRSFHSLLKDSISVTVEINLCYTDTDKVDAIKKAWKELKPETIVNSFRHCGVEPLDPLRIEAMVQSERAACEIRDRALVQQVTDVLLNHFDLSCRMNARRDADREIRRERRAAAQHFTTDFGVVLTRPQAIAALELQRELTALRHLKKNELKTALTEKYGVPPEQLMVKKELKKGEKEVEMKVEQMIEVAEKKTKERLDQIMAKVEKVLPSQMRSGLEEFVVRLEAQAGDESLVHDE